MNRDEFLLVDQRIFDRLSWGSLAPLRLTLKSGVTVVGETKGIARGNSDGPNAVYWGRVLVASDGCDVEVDYTAIADIG